MMNWHWSEWVLSDQTAGQLISEQLLLGSGQQLDWWMDYG